jgi:hypothetical protein
MLMDIGMGILYKLAIDTGTNVFRLDLLSGESSPEFRHSKRIAAPYADYMFRQIRKRKFDDHQIAKAIVEIEFHVDPTKRQIMFKGTWGEPFVCSVVITDDLNREHSQEERGWCGAHDPKREHRSTRRHAS